jgi:uncharacterized repeat protein (TIGR03837 family)
MRLCLTDLDFICVKGDMRKNSSWDIFCRVVDNYGDIGVCWRLAKQLQAEHGLQVRLWVDDWVVAQHLIPALNSTTQVDGVDIQDWHDAADFSHAADVVVEAFAGGLPPSYLTAMQAQQSKWINLEYLSAETWVDDFHGKPSPQAGGMVRHFYFPGFTPKTGGLLREKTLKPLEIGTQQQDSALTISLFSYPDAAIAELLAALSEAKQTVHVLVPASAILPTIAQFFGLGALAVGDSIRKKNLTVTVLPFLSQADYDALLRDCDLNFVRGEDSWVRAIWAAKPFIWQPYMQEEGAHLQKLNAFLSLFYANFNQKELPCKAHQYWAAGHAPHTFWGDYLAQLPAIAAYTHVQSQALAAQADLATQLIAFSARIENGNAHNRTPTETG